MYSNKEVAGLFKTLCGLMELHGENDFKTKSYANAAFQLGRLHDPVLTMPDDMLEKQPGVGKSVLAKIQELRNTGSIKALEELVQITPPGLLEILQIKGLGGKKVGLIWRDLGIESVGELLYACHENRLAKLKGFGEKTQQSVIQSIEYYQSNMGKFHYATVADEADEIVAILQQELHGNKVSLCGDIRRMCNVVDRIDIICSRDYGISEQLQRFNFLTVKEITEDLIKAETANGFSVAIALVNDEDYYYALFLGTGSVVHVEQVIAGLNGKVHFDSEESIYAAANMPYVLPELREPEVDTALPHHELITLADIKGVVHNHSIWSDGKNSIAEMADACKAAGYQYFVISDHSKTAVYAGGLTEQQIIDQHKEIDALNLANPGFKIFKSIECDILFDGGLDYNNTVLSSFDLVITSVHQNLKMDEEKATSRLLRAIENPYTTILGHMTGRLLLSRPGYPVDHQRIIEACASNDVVIEINANPYRLDIDHTWIPYALKKGVMISINPDAHSIGGIQDIDWGVISARKGALTRSMTWNAMDRQGIEQWLSERKKKKGI